MILALVTLFIVGTFGLQAASKRQQRTMMPALVRIDPRR
jgi:hypothetical protein